MPTRAELLDTLADQMTSAADSVPGDWDRFAIVAEITALGVRVTGFRYQGDGPGMPMLMDTRMIDTIAQLREVSPVPDSGPFDVYVARMARHDGAVEDQGFTAEAGRAFRVTASAVGLVADRVRPGVPLVGSLPEAPPASEVSTEPVAGADHETETAAPATSADAAPEPESTPDDDPAAAALSALAATVVGWPELAGDDWDGYGAVAVIPVDGDLAADTIGVRHLGDGAAHATLVGGDFLDQLRALRDASPDEQGRRAGAVLLRLARDHGPVAVRFVYDPQAVAAMTWTGLEPALADRLRLVPRSAPTPAVAPREAAAGLSTAALVERIRADLQASLRARDRWHRFALGVDVARSRAVGAVYDQDGTPQPFRPALLEFADLAALRQHTARPDGEMWAGLRALIWRGGDRVDLTFYGAEGMDRFLGGGPQAALGALQPPAEPPADGPALPWPS